MVIDPWPSTIRPISPARGRPAFTNPCRRQPRWNAIICTLFRADRASYLRMHIHTRHSFRIHECVTPIVLTHSETPLHLLTFDSNDNTCGERDRIWSRSFSLVAIIFYVREHKRQCVHALWNSAVERYSFVVCSVESGQVHQSFSADELNFLLEKEKERHHPR